MRRIIHFLLLFNWVFGYATKLSAQELTIYTAKKIYVGDTAMSLVESVVCEKDKIIFTGPAALSKALYPNAKSVHFKNQFE